MQWKRVQFSEPRERSQMDFGGVTLSIGPAQGGGNELWQHLIFTVGEHSRESVGNLEQTWPARAIELARAALDEFEQQLAPQRWKLDTGNDGNDEELEGTREQVMHDVMHHHDMAEWPAHWTLEKL